MRRHHHHTKPNETSTESISYTSSDRLNHFQAIDPTLNHLTRRTQTQATNQKVDIYGKIGSVLSVIFYEGFLDSLRIHIILDSLKSKPGLRVKIIQNSLLQLVLIASIIVFQSFSDSRDSFWSTLDLLFKVFWLLPVMLISILWNSTISEKILSNDFGSEEKTMAERIKLTKPKEIIKYLKLKINSDYHKILILLNYFLMSKGLLDYVPINLIGIFSSFIFCSIANSFYCFEQSWSKEGLNFEQRLDLLEKQWDYHLGFGLAITTLTSLYPHHLIINISIFTLFFPFLLILSTTKTDQEKPNHHADRFSSKKSTSWNHSIQLPIFFISRLFHSFILRFTCSTQPFHPHPTLGIHHNDFIEDGRDRLLD